MTSGKICCKIKISLKKNEVMNCDITNWFGAQQYGFTQHGYQLEFWQRSDL